MAKIESQYLTPQEIKEFQKLAYDAKGIRLTPQEALDQGTRLIMLVELVIKKFQPIQLSYKDMVDISAQKNKNAIK